MLPRRGLAVLVSLLALAFCQGPQVRVPKNFLFVVCWQDDTACLFSHSYGDSTHRERVRGVVVHYYGPASIGCSVDWSGASIAYSQEYSTTCTAAKIRRHCMDHLMSFVCKVVSTFSVTTHLADALTDETCKSGTGLQTSFAKCLFYFFLVFIFSEQYDRNFMTGDLRSQHHGQCTQ